MSAKFIPWKNGKGRNYLFGSDKEIDKLARAYLDAGKAKRSAGAALAKALSADVGVALAVSESKWPRDKEGNYDVTVFPATRTATSTVQPQSGEEAFGTKAA